MKKLILFICCIIAAMSCNLNGSYYAENVAEIVTIQSGKPWSRNPESRSLP